jgi:hypothetical protein
VNRKGCGRKRSWPKLIQHPGFSLRTNVLEYKVEFLNLYRKKLKYYSPNKEMAHKVRSNLGSYLVLAAVFTTSRHNCPIQPFLNSRPTFWFMRISKRAPLNQDIPPLALNQLCNYFLLIHSTLITKNTLPLRLSAD